jgi:hypothetical protein
VTSNINLKEIIFALDQQPYTDLPLVIMVTIPSYQGPYEMKNVAGDPIIPMVPSISRRKKDNQNCSRKQYPLRLAYAISIHKFQGMTLKNAVLKLEERDFRRGLLFVAISRVRT